MGATSRGVLCHGVDERIENIATRRQLGVLVGCCKGCRRARRNSYQYRGIRRRNGCRGFGNAVGHNSVEFVRVARIFKQRAALREVDILDPRDRRRAVRNTRPI